MAFCNWFIYFCQGSGVFTISQSKMRMNLSTLAHASRHINTPQVYARKSVIWAHWSLLPWQIFHVSGMKTHFHEKVWKRFNKLEKSVKFPQTGWNKRNHINIDNKKDWFELAWYIAYHTYFVWSDSLSLFSWSNSVLILCSSFDSELSSDFNTLSVCRLACRSAFNFLISDSKLLRENKLLI